MPTNKIEGVYEIRIEQGPALRKFEELKKRLDDTRAGIRDMNKETKALIAGEQAIEKAVAAAGHATEEQAAALARMREEREKTNKALSEAVITEKALSAQIRELSNDLSGLTEHGLRFRDKMAQATTIALQQSGVIEALGDRHKELSRSLGAVNDAVKGTEEKMAVLATAFAKAEVSEEQYTQLQDQLTRELTDAKAAQKLLTDELGKVTGTMSKLDEGVHRLNEELNAGKITSAQYAQSLKGLEDEAKRAADAQGQLGSRFDQFVAGQGKELKSTLTSLATSYVGVGAAVYGIQKAFVSVGTTIAEFEAQLSKVSALGGEYADRIDELGASAIALGPKFGRGPKEAAESIEALAKAGVSAADIMSGALEGALSLSAAGSLEAGQAAEYAASTMVQFGLRGQDMTHVADLLAGAANKAQGEVSDFGNALKFVGPVANAMNVGLEETTGTLALFASNGILGEQAGTSLRGVLASLTSPSKQATEQLKTLGIITADGANALYDAQGNFKGLANLAGELARATSGLTQEQRDQALGQIFGNQQLTAANILLKGGAEAVGEWTGAVDESGIALRIASEQMDNISGRADQVSASWEALVVNIDKGDSAFSNFIKGTLGGLNTLLQELAGVNTALLDMQAALDERAAQGLVNKQDYEFEKNTLEVMKEREKILENISDLDTGINNESIVSWLKRNEVLGDYAAHAVRAEESAAGLAEVEGYLNDARRESQPILLAASKGLDRLSYTQRVEFEARSAILDVLEKEVERRRSATAEAKKQAVAQEQAAAAAEAEKNAKATSSTATVGQRLEYLNAELETAKKNRNDLNVADTAGIAAADRYIATLQKQIDALNGSSKATSRLSEADRERIALVKELTAAEEKRAQADLTPQQIEKQQVTVQRDERIEQAKGDTSLLRRIENDYQAQLSEIRARYAKARQDAEEVAARVLLESQARSDDASLAAEEDRYSAKIDAVRRAAEAAGLAQEEIDRRVEATRAVIDQQLFDERIARLDRQQEAERQKILEQYEQLYADAEAAGQSTIALQESAGKELAAITVKYNTLRAEANQVVTDSFLAAQAAEREAVVLSGEDITAVIARQLEERRALVQRANDAELASINERFEAEYAAADATGADTSAIIIEHEGAIYAAKEEFRQKDLELQQQYNNYLQQMEVARTMAAVNSFQQIAASAQSAIGSIIEIIDEQTRAQVAAIDEQIKAAEAQGQSTEELEKEKTRVEEEGAKKRAKAQRAANVVTALSAIAAAIGQAMAAAAPGDPYTVAARIAAAVAAAIAAAASVYKAISATPAYAQGGTVEDASGTVTQGWGHPIRRRNGDNVLVRAGRGYVTLKTGEKVLNKDQQEELERMAGRGVWGAIGLPGYASGGAIMRDFRTTVSASGYAEGGTVGIVTPRPAPQTIVQNQVVQSLRSFADRPTFVSVKEIRDVSSRVDVIETYGTL